MVSMRLPAERIEAIDDWAEKEGVSRSEAIRRLVEQALGEPPKATKPRAHSK